ncbi:hypothetical protein KHS38_02430 [Mucilaginibacter sp. Bleaf8]|uniref:hypothetical protein n=1 Tax=Mucilaginibacter sp. Bleaf8 TaxID=2834430 RepID=UPI001BCB0D5C|nr:hypothetical protein [Mucilaginibacter sp. Bleaf8]MBS7563250.1 hypothetical protein [Mucilaginibacter sp. Bleaf8]
MSKIWTLIFDWAEVWALLIPLAVLLRFGKQPPINKYIIVYISISLPINLLIDLTWKLRTILPANLNSNNYLYNLNAIITFILFTLFFQKLRQPFMQVVKSIIPIVFVVFLIVNFGFYEKFFDYWKFSSRLLAIEAGLLLFDCLLYYFNKVKDENETLNVHQSEFWIVTGLGIYVAVNFFIFLLYNELTRLASPFAVQIWNVHNISYIVFNLFIARGLYESGRK